MVGNLHRNQENTENLTMCHRGIVILASNTPETDYVSMAESTAKHASNTLQLPYTVIDVNNQDSRNTRHCIDTNEYVQWNNTGRHSVFDLSPYEETLVIDADYLVNTRNLLSIFDLKWDYLLSKNYTTIGEPITNDINNTKFKYLWATCFVFRKTNTTRLFFNMVKRIQNNWGYYRLLYNIDARNFRNDIAFTLADSILSGYSISKNTLPYTLNHVTIPNVSIKKT